MVSPIELTKLGVRARIQKLGSLNYILIASFLLLVLGAVEIWRYNEYQQCISKQTQHFEEVFKSVKGSTGMEIYTRYFEVLEKYKCRVGYSYDIFTWFSWLNPIRIAHAQIRIGEYSESDIRGVIIISIFGCMGVFFFVSTGALLFSKNAKVVAFAMDSVKTLLGFFIGVAMTFMGVR